jgi:hypothetical protein
VSRLPEAVLSRENFLFSILQDAVFQASLVADRAREAELRKIAEERERIEKGAAAQAERKRQEKAAWEVSGLGEVCLGGNVSSGCSVIRDAKIERSVAS